MYKFDPMKRCVLCGCLALLIITYSGPICKRCLERLHQENHLPGGFYYDFSLDNLDNYNSRSAIEATVTGAVSLPTDYIGFNN